MTTEIVDRNYKIELKHTQNDDCNITFTFGELTLIKNDYYDLFSMDSLINTISGIIQRKFNVQHYINSFGFYQQLTLIDQDIERYGYVYLRIVDKENKICKIGRTFDINRRYNEEDRGNIILLYPVDNDNTVENKLIREFNKYFIKVSGTRESFKYKGISTIKELFNNVCKNHIVKPDYMKSSHIQELKIEDRRHTALYVSLPVCEIIFNNYVKEPKHIRKFNTMKGYIIDTLNKDVYISNEYNKVLKTKCIYWKFHKYTIIQNENDLYVNGSRLWNSIIRNDKLDVKMKLSKFLSSKRIQEIKAQFEELYPNKKFYITNVVNQEQPYFSGTYVHYILIHFIISRLNAKYAIMVSELMYRQYYNNFLKETKPKTMKGGGRMLTLDEYNKRYLENFKNINDIPSLLSILGISFIS